MEINNFSNTVNFSTDILSTNGKSIINYSINIVNTNTDITNTNKKCIMINSINKNSELITPDEAFNYR